MSKLNLKVFFQTFLLLQYYILPVKQLHQEQKSRSNASSSKDNRNGKNEKIDINDFTLQDLGENIHSYEGGEEDNMEFTKIDSSTEDISDYAEWIANDPLLMQELMNGIKREKKYKKYFSESTSPKQEQFYHEYLKKRDMTNTYPVGTSNDQVCPQSELYAKIWQINSAYSGAYHTIYVQDLEIRDSDRDVFFTGKYYTPNDPQANTRHCFFLRMTYLGVYEYGSFIWHHSANNVYSECNALTLTEDNKVVATGNYYNGNDQAHLGKHSALLVLTNDQFTSQTIKIWSASTLSPSWDYSTYGNDVAVTADGSIFVTGYTSGWTSGNNDCFILKVDYQLEQIYAKSFGTNYEEQCASIQLTRNFDYIYVGGSQQYDGVNWQLFFLKMDGYAESVYYSYYVQPVQPRSLQLKNILLRNPRDAISAYTYPTPASYSTGSADTNNLLYFCATYTDGITYFAFGVLSYQMVLQQMYSYGDPNNNGIANNVMGDCDVTNDGRFMVGTMGTGGGSSTQSYITADYTIPVVSQLWAPFSCNGASTISCSTSCYCYVDSTDYDSILSAATYATVQTDCRNDLFASISSYLSLYNTNAYSWHTCDAYYTFNYNDINCDISLTFTGCTSGFLATGGDACCYSSCNTIGFQAWLNTYKPWYRNYLGAYWAEDQQFMDEEFKDNICNAGTSYYQSWESYWFCTENTATFGDGAWDQFDMVFEQDCLTNAQTGIPYLQTQKSDFFIFKIDLSSISHLSTWRDYSPVNAVYFGENDGNEYPYAIGVDEWGFIVVAGTTDSPNFGVPSNTLSMLYIKTHWDLNYELDNGEANLDTTYPWSQVPSVSYLKKRFITPKKFMNSLGGITFMRDLLYSACTVVAGNGYIECGTLIQTYVYPNSDQMFQDWIPYPINERVFTPTLNAAGYDYIYLTYTTPGSFYGSYQHNYGQGQSSITLPYTYYISKGQNFNQDLPLLCLKSTRYYERKTFEFHIGTGLYAIQGMSIKNYSNSYTDSQSGPPYAYATSPTVGVTSIEGIYYQDKYLVGVKSIYNYCSGTSTQPWVKCSHPNTYYNYMDDANYTSLRRFNFAVRLKYIVDDTTLNPPTIAQDIPSQTVTAGLLSTLQIAPLTTYFTGCTYLKAKQVPDTTQSDYRSSTQIPKWIVFYEFNQTFVMYPPDTLTTANPVIQLELICCNNIDQCVSNTFSITCTNTLPTTVSLATTSYTLQYDTLTNTGQHFTFARTSTQFIDTLDTNYATFSYTDLYSHQAQSHSVLLTYTASYFWNGGNPAFGSVDYIGMIYGEPQSTSTFGLNTITFSYFDQFSFSSQSASFTIYINKEPTATAVGTAYQFGLIDPLSVNTQNNIFTQKFPWLKTSAATSIVYVDTSLWFAVQDGLKLTYSCTYSDGTNRENWIGYNTVNGLLKSNMIEYVPSEYMNLKITGTDPHQGSYSFYKPMLVDSQPIPRVAFIIFYCSVGLSCSYDFSDIFSDPNGDYLTYEMPQALQITALTAAGFEFSSPTQIVFGEGKMIEVIPLNEIKATDPFGLYNQIYFTIVVVDSKPYVRGLKYSKLPDQTITEGYLYYFTIPNNIVFDPFQGAALLLYATTPTKLKLPSWITFNPMSYSFNGKGPGPSPQQQKVMVTFMNQLTEDTEQMEFTIYVIPNNNPVTNVKYLNQDYLIYQYTYFDGSLQRLLYSDVETDRFSSIQCAGSSGQDLPQWLTFNEINRTVYGFANTPGVYRVDFTFTDDAGKSTYSNIMIKVLPVNNEIKSLNLHYFLAVWFTVGLTIYMSYAYHFHLTLFRKQLTQKNEDTQIAKETKKRFQEYQDVEIMYVIPELMDSSNSMDKDPVITNDSDFLGIDKIRKWRRKQQKIKEKLRKKK